MPTHPLHRLRPSFDPLLDLVFQRVDDAMLREIAAAANGMEVEAHLDGLRAIKQGHIPAPMEWEPKEVLELIRWSEPGIPPDKPPPIVVREHWNRLFSCAVLLRAATEPENQHRFLAEDSTIVQLVESALSLGREASVAARRFLCSLALIDQSRDGLICPYCAVAVAFLSVSLNQCDQHIIAFLVSALLPGDLILTELFAECQREQKWKTLVERFLLDASAPHEINVIGNQLLGLPRAAGWHSTP